MLRLFNLVLELKCWVLFARCFGHHGCCVLCHLDDGDLRSNSFFARQCQVTGRCQGTGPARYQVTTVAPVMFGKPLLNNVLAFDHGLLQK